MAQITHGTITYGRTVKTGDYENKRAEASFSFTVADGEDHEEVADRASNLAYYHTHRLLGLQSSAEAPSDATAPEVTDRSTAAKRGPRSAKAPTPPPAPAPAPKTDPAAVTEAAPVVPGIAEPAAVSEPSAPAKPATDPATVAPPDDLMTAAPSVITDKDLAEAVTRTNAKIKNAMAIRQLIGKYVTPPQAVHDIPQDKRQAFLTQLGAL